MDDFSNLVLLRPLFPCGASNSEDIFVFTSPPPGLFFLVGSVERCGTRFELCVLARATKKRGVSGGHFWSLQEPSAHWRMAAGKGGIQGWCQWVCVLYACVIMGMWRYKSAACVACRASLFVCVCASTCVWPSYATHYITDVC